MLLHHSERWQFGANGPVRNRPSAQYSARSPRECGGVRFNDPNRAPVFPLLTAIVPAHETWFETLTTGPDWGFYFSALPLTLTAVMIVVTVAWRMVALRINGPELELLRPLG